MAAKLDKSLDEIMTEGKGGRGRGFAGGRGGRGGGRGRRSFDDFPRSAGNGYRNPLARDDEEEDFGGDDSFGPARRDRGTRRVRDAAGPYGRTRAFDDNAEWVHDRFEAPAPVARGAVTVGAGSVAARIEPGTKVIVSGLDPEVSADDINEIFEQIGNIRSVQVFYDQNGKSLGSAEVTFHTTASAAKAVAEYDKAEVDGRPMSLKLVGDVIPPPRVIKKASRPTVVEAPPRPIRQYRNYDDSYDRPYRGGRGGARTGGGFPSRSRFGGGSSGGGGASGSW